MNSLKLGVAILMLGLPLCMPATAETISRSSPVLSEYVQCRISEFEQIGESRKAELTNAADLIQAKRNAGETVQLNFICTHNSRRSHLAQIWAAVAANENGIENIITFSGGTEATAMNSRIVDALRRAGLEVESSGSDDEQQSNPRYQVRYASDQQPLDCFSKVYNEPPNPRDSFVAILVCGNADEACPIVAGATDRLVIRYIDPKVSDNTPEEKATYDERCAQISREMLFMISKLDR